MSKFLHPITSVRILNRLGSTTMCMCVDGQAALDFRDRIRLYEKHYETIDENELTWVKLINIGSQVIINRIQDFLQSRIVYYLMNLHIRPRSIYLSRVSSISDLF